MRLEGVSLLEIFKDLPGAKHVRLSLMTSLK